MTSPLVISFYTPDYKEISENLRKSLKKHNIIFQMEEIPDPGTWYRTVNKKQEFIKEMILKYNVPCLWIDADAIIRKPLTELFKILRNGNPDIAYHFKDDTQEILTGTIFFNNNIRSMRLLDLWIEEGKRYPDRAGQPNLKNVINRWEGTITFLGVENCCIFDVKERRECDPVIEHFQASRKYRRKNIK